MTDELTPVRCGCGGEAKIDKHTYYRALPTYGVRCHRCGQQTRHFYMTEAEAITAWNKAISGSTEKSSTVERTAKVDAGHKSVITGKLMDGHCMQCGRYVMDEDDYCPGCGARLEWK